MTVPLTAALMACGFDIYIHRALITTDCVDGTEVEAAYWFNVPEASACQGDCTGIVSTGHLEADGTPLGTVYFRTWRGEPNDYRIIFEEAGEERWCDVEEDEVGRPIGCTRPGTSDACFVMVEPLD